MHVGACVLQLWPRLALWFGLGVAPPLRIPLTMFMPHHKDLWASIVKKYNLKDIPFEKVLCPNQSCYQCSIFNFASFRYELQVQMQSPSAQ